jgi:predicted SnoaL-like aldol condensation-catalyzing enzyme
VDNDATVNSAAFRMLLEQGFGVGDLDVVDSLVSDACVEHQFGINPPNREGVKAAVTFLHRLAPDFSTRVEALCVDGDLVWGRMTSRGTHTGPSLGEPTGRPFEVTVIDVCRFRDGRVVEHWGVADRFAQMHQLGLLPGGPAVDVPG